MGSLFKSKSPNSLLQTLVAAADSPAMLVQLCQKNQAEIVAQFPQWRVLPAEVRKDQAAIQRYGNGLFAVAKCFSEHLGDASLLKGLLGPQESSTQDQVRAMQRAQGLMAEFKYREACQLLVETLSPGVQEYRPHILGLLAQGQFMDGAAPDQPLRLLQEALAICGERDDQEGQIAYLGSLYEIFRYHGDSLQARDMATNLARLLEPCDPPQARYFATQARILAKGEPLNRVQARLGNQRYEIEEVPVPLVAATLQLSFERNRITLKPAAATLDHGKRLGSQGDLEKALEAFQAAAALDRYDPDPHYQMGFAYLQLGRYREAAAACQRADELAPGWFSCRCDGWLARELAEGRLDPLTFKGLNHLEDGGDPPQTNLEIAGKLQATAGKLGLYHLHCGKVLQQLGQTREAIAAFQRGLEGHLEDEVRTRLLVSWATAESDRGRRQELFHQAWELNGHLVSAASARIALRSETLS